MNMMMTKMMSMMTITLSLSMMVLSLWAMLDDNDEPDERDGDDDDDHPVAVHDGVEPVCYGEDCAVRKLLPVNDQQLLR